MDKGIQRIRQIATIGGELSQSVRTAHRVCDGYALGTDRLFHFATLAYDSSTGSRLWVQRYQRQPHARAVAADGRGRPASGILASEEPRAIDDRLTRKTPLCRAQISP